MSVRADWRLADLLDEGDDPFDAMIYSSGLHVNLAGSEEDLTAALTRALKLEGKLWDIGLSCPLKEAGQNCLTCKETTMDPELPLTRLCQVGKDEQTIVKQMDERQATRNAPWIELAGSVAEFDEIGQLDGAYDELLTAVGL